MNQELQTDGFPSTHGGNGRTRSGKFAPGNKCGRGNPLAGHAAKIRARLLQQVEPADIDAIGAKLIAMSKAGDLAAIRELFDRLIGKPVPFEFLERLEALEAARADEGRMNATFTPM